MAWGAAILFPHRSYGGLRWGIDLPEMLAPLAYILRMRTVPLRNLGGCMSPDNAWMALQGIETLPMAPTRRPFPFESERRWRPSAVYATGARRRRDPTTSVDVPRSAWRITARTP